MGEIARLFPHLDVETKAQESESAASDPLFGEAVRIAEAMLFAAADLLNESEIEKRMPNGVAVARVLERLKQDYASRGVNLVRVGHKWMFRTASDLGWLLSRSETEPKKLSKAALETLAIIAYHQPVTRAEIEDVRGVGISKGTLDVLLETGWVRLRGRRKAPGRPVTYATTENFLLHFGLEAIGDLPGLDELKGAGLFDGRLPKEFQIPLPNDDLALTADEDPLEDDAAPELLLDLDQPEPEAEDDGDDDGDRPLEDDGSIES